MLQKSHLRLPSFFFTYSQGDIAQNQASHPNCMLVTPAHPDSTLKSRLVYLMSYLVSYSFQLIQQIFIDTYYLQVIVSLLLGRDSLFYSNSKK